ncbi:MAG TPA: anti-sigma factor domain-containing protein [Desulfotomaculum sp.]|nr:anti-sigma factor domain-containing protein [Desulfotomaculum sp.]
MAIKGLIMKKHDGKGVVLTSKGEFKLVSLSPERRVGEKISLGPKQVAKTYTLWLAASLLAIALCYHAFFAFLPQAAAYVSLDTGDTVLEMGLDRQGKIVAVDAFTPSAEAVVQKAALKGQRLSDGLRLVLQAGKPAPYRPEALVFATLTNPAGKDAVLRPAELAQVIAAVFAGEETAPKIVVAAVTPETRRQAIEAGFPPGRFILWQAAQEQELFIPTEVLRREPLDVVESNLNLKVEELAPQRGAAQEGRLVVVLPAKKALPAPQQPEPEDEDVQRAPPEPKAPEPTASPPAQHREPLQPTPALVPEQAPTPPPEEEKKPVPAEEAPAPTEAPAAIEEPAPVEEAPAPTEEEPLPTDEETAPPADEENESTDEGKPVTSPTPTPEPESTETGTT